MIPGPGSTTVAHARPSPTRWSVPAQSWSAVSGYGTAVSAVSAVGSVRPVTARPDLARFAEVLDQAGSFAAESARLRATWPDGGTSTTPRSAPAQTALARLAEASIRIVDGRPDRATAAAASRAYRAVAAAGEP